MSKWLIAQLYAIWLYTETEKWAYNQATNMIPITQCIEYMGVIILMGY